ncbi:type VI secretion system baseplate subunit TssF, partial [Klebsiella pneumoniae]
DLVGLDLDAVPDDSAFVDIEIVLAKPFPDDMRFTADNIRLYCTPIINLFDLEADPITVNQFDTEYRVRAMEHHGKHVEPYSVDTVRGFEAET